MMGKRDTGTSTNVRPKHDDNTLLVFETFKKKFLLANKHITKLNSTLSVRIEELNAQISALYVENLRLRASEISLGAQLRREREKSRKIMAHAEAATFNLTKDLALMRQSFSIPPEPSSHERTLPQPRPKRASPSDESHQTTRLSKPPGFPGILEDGPFSSEDVLPSLAGKRGLATAISSVLPLSSPARVNSPPVPTISPLPADPGRKRPLRRRIFVPNISGRSSPPLRAPKPVFGSSIRREAALAVTSDSDDDDTDTTAISDFGFRGVRTYEKGRAKVPWAVTVPEHDEESELNLPLSPGRVSLPPISGFDRKQPLKRQSGASGDDNENEATEVSDFWDVGPNEKARSKETEKQSEAVPEAAPEPLSYFLDLTPLDDLVDPIPEYEPQSVLLDLYPLDDLISPVPEVEPQGPAHLELHCAEDWSRISESIGHEA